MAQSTASRLSLDEVRASVKRMQTQGEKLVGRFGKDARAFVARAQVVSLEDARKRATKVVREIDDQRTRLGKMLIEQVEALLAQARKAVGIAGLAELAALAKRVSHVEHHQADPKEIARLHERLAELERRVERLTKAA
jgi:hypothetical protein